MTLTVRTEKAADIISAAKEVERECGGFRLITENNGGFHSYADYTLIKKGRMKMTPEIEQKIIARAEASCEFGARLFRMSGAADF